jgi:hypothetical protein
LEDPTLGVCLVVSDRGECQRVWRRRLYAIRTTPAARLATPAIIDGATDDGAPVSGNTTAAGGAFAGGVVAAGVGGGVVGGEVDGELDGGAAGVTSTTDAPRSSASAGNVTT